MSDDRGNGGRGHDERGHDERGGDERRYDEEEARRIFDVATRAEASRSPPVPGRRGLTLAELQAIASEAGIPPGLISEAARTLERDAAEAGSRSLDRQGGARLRPRVLGVPLGVEHEVALPRNPTGEEWARMVVHLRRTFAAKGRVEAVGPLREWRNGNLFVSVMPEGDGAVLSMGTFDGRARPFATASALLLSIALVLVVVMLVTGEISGAGDLFGPGFLGGFGLVILGMNALRLPGWARTRARQFEEVGARVVALTSGGPYDVDDATGDDATGDDATGDAAIPGRQP